MENSARAEVGEFAARLAKLCDSPLKFYNLDVREVGLLSASAGRIGRCKRRSPLRQ
jgi:hypothetical protein